MKTICVDASKAYQVHIDSHLISDAGDYIAALTAPCKAAIISDTNVFPIYGNMLQDSLKAAGFSVISFVFTAGEASKNGDTYLEILNFLAENALTRSDILIALGGGVVGDITGFAAATYLRGISYVQIPTTLLAMVDSSVGGKTAIDLAAGKNLAGAFYQPSLVLCDLTALQTLSEDVFSDGCAEVIKYGVLYDSKLFSYLLDNGLHFDREYVIARCIELKRNVVKEDEFDRGSRQMLNLGHTIGHGIEKQSNFTISHGKAVAAGMAIIAKAAWKYEICDHAVYENICKILTIFDLPISTAYSADALYMSALSDKKRAGDNVNLIVPLKIGHCIIQKTPTNDVKSFIEAGL